MAYGLAEELAYGLVVEAATAVADLAAVTGEQQEGIRANAELLNVNGEC